MENFVYILFALTYIAHAQEIDLKCSEKFCSDYITKTPCVSVPNKCSIQNSTHNGIFLPFHGPCNCCDYCLENLAESESCAIGSPSSSTPTTICGPGLSCKKENDASPSLCDTIDSDCTKAQAEYDRKELDGTLGHLELRPECDSNGLFKPYVCIPGQNCFCVDETGLRIFGDAKFTSAPGINIRCDCSRKYEAVKKIIGRPLTPLEHFRCTSNGDYDTLQCIGEMCTCVDNRDGSALDPEKKLINMTLISNETLTCHNSKIHAPFGKYRFECEQKYIDAINDIIDLEEDGKVSVIGTVFPRCQPDGKYDTIQISENYQHCADENGKKLEQFEVERSDPLSKTMDCKCARARALVEGDEKPDCCKNGNYKRIQCRRDLCRCVDSNGIQVEKEVHISQKNQLKCKFLSECTESNFIV